MGHSTTDFPRVASFILSLVLLSEIGLVDADSLTVDQAVAVFYQNNLDLIAAHYAIDQTVADRTIAAAVPNPILSVTQYELNPRMLDDGHSHLGPALAPQIQQLIETAGKRRLRTEGSEFATTAAELDFRDTVRLLSNAVRHAFFDALLAQKTTEIAHGNMDRYDQIEAADARRFQSAEIAEADLVRVQVEKLHAQADRDRAEAALKLAQTKLLQLLGWPERFQRLALADEWPQVIPELAQQDEELLVKKALVSRPDYLAAAERIQQAQSNLTLARRLAVPDVTISAGYARDPSNNALDTASVGISVPLPLFYRQEGEIGKAEVALNSAELALRQLEQQIQVDVRTALTTFQSAQAIAERFQSTMLDRIEKLRRGQEYAYQRGAISLLELIDAERSYQAAMLEAYAAFAARTTAAVDLSTAVGIDGSAKP